MLMQSEFVYLYVFKDFGFQRILILSEATVQLIYVKLFCFNLSLSLCFFKNENLKS